MTTVLPHTAAAEAGVQIGDVIVEIDGLPTASMHLSEFAALVRRPVGTTVRLGAVRDGTVRRVVLILKDICLLYTSPSPRDS